MPLPPALFIGVVGTFIGIVLLMRPRRFYLIRHGETVLNAEHIKQGADGALSEKGRRQAKNVGKYLKRFPIRRIIASTYPRAQETAQIINEQLKVPLNYSKLLVERRNPSDIIGKSTRGPEVTRVVDQIDLAYHEDDYRYSNEENFVDLKKRAKKCLRFLARRQTTEIAVITHHVFLKMLIAYLLYRERVHSPEFVKLSFFNVSDNAGITICEYHPWKMFNRTRGWEIVSYNEQPEI